MFRFLIEGSFLFFDIFWETIDLSVRDVKLPGIKKEVDYILYIKKDDFNILLSMILTLALSEL